MTPTVERRSGAAGDLHALEVTAADAGSIWWLDASAPALVLGSTQPQTTVDLGRAAARGVEVVRRRSGGGAVYVASDALTWIDVVIGPDDPRWCDDVNRSFDWLGAAWVDALDALGLCGGRAHAGAMVRSPWSSLVCFGGLGPGEVTFDGRKLVGIAQRRTRDAARFQCAALHRWDPTEVTDLLAIDAVDRDRASTELRRVAVGLEELGAAALAGEAMVGALAAAIAR
ncbi:MAG: hypothetical protein R2701_12685 [Acidimicrobiales bacterium]|nr:lipoate--protein ligase family protein [Acidimicrobiales bacterium]